MTELLPQISEEDVDRIRAVSNIGAGHAANALAAIVGTTFLMRVPQVRVLPPERISVPFVVDSSQGDGRDAIGIFFEIEGGFGGVIGLLFPPSTCERLIQVLTGKAPEESTLETVQSALRELGNILVSHVTNAVSETLGVTMLPSIPVLAMKDAADALASILATRASARPAVRVETAIFDRKREVRGLIVFVPDRLDRATPAPGF